MITLSLSLSTCVPLQIEKHEHKVIEPVVFDNNNFYIMSSILFGARRI